MLLLSPTDILRILLHQLLCHSSIGVTMENYVKVKRFVFLLILFGIFTFICSGVNSSEFNTDGEYFYRPQTKFGAR